MRVFLGLLLFAVVLALGVAAGLGAALLLKRTSVGPDARHWIATLCCVLIALILVWCLRWRGMLQQVEYRKGRVLVAVVAWFALAAVAYYALSRAISPFDAIELHAQNAKAPPGRPAGELRVSTYNIAHGRGPVSSNFEGGDRATRAARLQQIAELLRDADLDIVVLNEVDFDSFWSGGVNQARAIAEAAGFPYWVEQRNVDCGLPWAYLEFGNAVLSRYPIADATLVNYPGYRWWETLLAGKKKGVVCTIDLPSGRSVRVLAVHLEHRDETTRVAAAELIAKLIDQLGDAAPLIAAGDFNSTRLDFPSAATDASGRSAISLLLEDGHFTTLPKALPKRSQCTFSSTNPQSVIDWILVQKPWSVTSVEVLPSELSDHRPVVGSLEVR